MFYTYILHSISHPGQRYIGNTADLKASLVKRNAGEVPLTTKFNSIINNHVKFTYNRGRDC